MALRIVTAIQRDGPPDPNEKFEIVLEDGTVLVGAAEYSSYPTVEFCLHRDHWPNEVTQLYHDTVEWLKDEYTQYHDLIPTWPPVAWVRSDNYKGQLSTGDTFRVNVRVGNLSLRYDRGEGVRFTSPIKTLRLLK